MAATCAQAPAATHTAITMPCMIRVWRATEARAGVVAGVAAALLVCPCHLLTACSDFFAVEQGGRAAAAEEEDEDMERGMAKEEEVKVEEVKMMVVEETDVLCSMKVWIGASSGGEARRCKTHRLRRQSTGECEERGSESQQTARESPQQARISTGRWPAQMLLLLLVLLLLKL